MFKRITRLVQYNNWDYLEIKFDMLLHVYLQELTPAEEEAMKSMSLKEALERRKELAKSRALQSYQEAKARRQNKIKSKT